MQLKQQTVPTGKANKQPRNKIRNSALIVARKDMAELLQVASEEENVQHMDTDANYAVMITTLNSSVEARTSRTVALTR